MHAQVGGGGNSPGTFIDFKPERRLEREDLPRRFQYLLKEDTTSFLYPKLLLMFQEIINREQLYPFFEQLNEEEQAFIAAIYGPDRVFSNDRLCEVCKISPEQRRKQVRRLRYRMDTFLTKHN
ncbi:hypothetical protein DUK53_17080 [Listeria sp. SHR_NRA_18]|uniref:hypothetical protein n=1 Tax=Listeria sp. SHR_NRA_18 TaxID=2269046 RepID=UPI000F5D765C|nr:hypothetical protein [Listeria sp. SHR_NRA_18]RQW65312.1 hypothetical protein DUK53_17080 [Listeria sp. SHR_NRA_18]